MPWPAFWSRKDNVGSAIRRKWFIAVSSFPIDSHDVQRIARPDGDVINEGTIFPVRMPGRRHGYPYHIPYRAILPKRGECDNLLVPVPLSCTHMGLSSIRVEPTWMILGQSAGIAAALIAKEDVCAHDLSYPRLRERLLAQGQVLELPTLPPLPKAPDPTGIDPKSLPGIILDDASGELLGEWATSTNFKPFIGRGYRHDDRRGDGNSSATFRFKSPPTGRYDLRMAYSPHPTRATNVPVIVFCGDARTEFKVDQTLALPPDQPFRSIGTVELQAGEVSILTISNTNTDGFVILDSLQLVPLASSK